MSPGNPSKHFLAVHSLIHFSYTKYFALKVSNEEYKDLGSPQGAGILVGEQ
jgi:hypothetical protein